jgi:predicted small integral membrane protein
MSSTDVRTLTRSFSAGEITPELFGRIDLAKYQTGLSKCHNFIVLPHGPIVNRAGLQYVLEVKDSTKPVRLIPFYYNTDQTYVLEVGHLYIRFHTAGGTLVENALNITAISQGSPGVFNIAAHGFSNGQTVQLLGIGGMTALNGRWVKIAGATTNTFTLTDLAGEAISTASLPAFTSGGTASRVYEVVTPYDTTAINLLDIHYVQSNNVMTLTHQTYPQQELRRVSVVNWTLTALSFVPSIVAPAGVSAVTGVGSGTVSYQYGVTSVDATTQEESFISTLSTCANNLNTAGNTNLITWSAVANAVRYNVYKSRSGLLCFAGQTPANSFTDDNILPDATRTPPNQGPLFNSTNNYPAAVSYFEQRRIFAGTLNQSQNMWMTRSGTESNMCSSIPTQDSDAISFRIAARDANSIRHIVPMDDLILLTSGGVWKVAPQNSDVITPSSVSVRPVASLGANMVQPVVIGKYILHAMPGGHVQEVTFSLYSNGYDVDDKSIMAPHLFDGYALVDLTYSYAPYRLGWFVRSDGAALSFTYLPKQEVEAWASHDTEGGAASFESVASVYESAVDVPYFIVRRTVNGRQVRYVERLKERRFPTLADSFIVDAGSQYVGAAVNTVTGLYHLEGKLVSILADGAVMPQKIVTNGAVSLPTGVTATKINVGLPITADAQTLPVTYDALAFGEGIQKNVNRVFLRVISSSGIFAGPSFDQLTAYKQRTNEPYGSPPSLVTSQISIDIAPTWGVDGQICVRQSDPLPLTVAAITLELAAGD